MATGRTHIKYLRVFVDGYDFSGYARSVGELAHTYDEGVDDVMNLNIKGTIPGQATVTLGPLNGMLDNTATSGLHVVMNGAGTPRNIMVCQGIQAAPANNDPAFACQLEQLAYHGNPDSNPVAVNIPFGNTSYSADNLVLARPWGVLLHANAATTAANSATGLDQTAQTTKGGFMMYQVTAGNGTATVKVQDASTNLDGSFGDLLSSGVIDCSSPISGVVSLAANATVERYVRWQIALGTATTVTFALSFHRIIN